MIRFSANLGFLWTDMSLPEAIHRAAEAGFDAVECHWPYDADPAEVRSVLHSTGMQMQSLNTRTGDRDGDFGLAAIPGREVEARTHIDEALAYADAIGCRAVSILAGRSGGALGSEATYRDNLAYAAARAADLGITVLIEPINTFAVPGYHLSLVDAGVQTIAAIGAENLRLMIDCFHTLKMEGELLPVFARVIDRVGHVQFASWPDRHEPGGDNVDYHVLLPQIVALGYDGAFGAEYVPRGRTVEEGLGWLRSWHDQRRPESAGPSDRSAAQRRESE